jgi:hypothetical protein
MAKNQKMTDKSAKDILDLMGKDMRDFFVKMPKVEEKSSKFVLDKKGNLVLKKEDGGPAAPIMPEEAKEIRKKKRRERNASRERTEMPSKKMREAMAKGYRDGGAVCRGMGAAIGGGKFSGVR